MKKRANHYAFIDSQNLNLGIQNLGWKLDFKRFRVYLQDKYNVSTAYYFIGYIPENQSLYASLQKAGYILMFKPVLPDREGKIKGNVDADLVLEAMVQYKKYNQAVIISSDGDFYSLVKHLYEHNKLKIVMSPYVKTCSTLLKNSAKEKIVFMDNLREKLQHKDNPKDNKDNKKKHRSRTKT